MQRISSLIKNLASTNNLLLLKVFDQNKICIATGIFPIFNSKMYFFGGASLTNYQRLLPNEALIWFAMRVAIEKGVKSFDMGGGGTYKRKYGGKIIKVPWIKISKYKILFLLRQFAKYSFKLKQRISI